MTPQSASQNLRIIGHSDQGGRADGVQVMLHAKHAYVGHMFSDGITVLDVQDPRAPRPVGFVACPINTRSHHIQVNDGILLATNSANIWAMQRYADQADYFTAPLADSFTRRERDFTAGLRVFSLENPAARSGSARWKASGCIAFGGWAANTPMPPVILMDSPIISWRFSTSQTQPVRIWSIAGRCPVWIAVLRKQCLGPQANAGRSTT